MNFGFIWQRYAVMSGRSQFDNVKSFTIEFWPLIAAYGLDTPEADILCRIAESSAYSGRYSYFQLITAQIAITRVQKRAALEHSFLYVLFNFVCTICIVSIAGFEKKRK
jgi:hypothetical protein